MMKKSNNGFTLAELLVVVAIIAVLVAIAVPVFTSQLEKSREATDLANVRAAYAKILSSAISEDSSSEYYKSPGVFEAEVALVQTKDGWTTDVSNMSIGHVKSADWDKHDPLGNGSCKLTYANGKMSIDWGGENPTQPGGASSGYTPITMLDKRTISLDALNELGENVVKKLTNTGTTKAVFASTTEEENPSGVQLRNQLKEILGWDEITIVYSNNGTYNNAVLISCIPKDVDANASLSKTTATRVFYDKSTGEVLAVWDEQKGNLGDNKGTYGFWSSQSVTPEQKVYEN